ncbi:MAG: peptide deformylase [Mycoplasmoidaceae bacterium]
MKKKIIPTMDWIIYDDNPLLKTKSEDVVFPLSEIEKETIDKMVAYIDASYESKEDEYNIKPGIGIAAIQLGLPKRIIYIHFDDSEKENKFLIANPKIIKEYSGKIYLQDGEGCLSVQKNIEGYSIRSKRLIVEAIDLTTNNVIKIDAEGYLACCIQHEIDHLNGTLYYDRINKFNPFFKKDDWEKI